jgi:membrane-anchored protein YejM (alkaline phosphatase superfamily)
VGIISLEGVKGKARHGFLMFLFMLLLGLVLGILYGAILQVAGMANIPFAAAMVSKFACVVIAVYLGSKLALGWTSKKVLEHIAAQIGSN